MLNSFANSEAELMRFDDLLVLAHLDRYSPEKGRGFKFDDRGAHRDGAHAAEPSQRSMREDMLEYLALEKDRKEAERRREEQDRKDSAMDGKETLFQEKKRSTYK